MSEPRDPGVNDSELGDPEPESQLIARLLAGEPGVVQLVRGWVRSTLQRYGSSLGSEIEDLEQQTLLDLLESLEAGKFRARSRFETYVRAFARYRSIDRLRAQGRREIVALDDLPLESPLPSPFEEATQRETAEQAQAVLARLPPDCRRIWTLIAQGRSYREMSQLLELSEGALRVRAFRCRQRAVSLRDELTAARSVTKLPNGRLTP